MGLTFTMEWDAKSQEALRRKLAVSRSKTGVGLPHVMTDPVDAFIYDLGHAVMRHASDRSPVDTGKMKKSLRFTWGPWGARVDAKKPAGWVDWGTKPHWPPVKALQGWARRHGIPAFLVARKIAKDGTERTDWFGGAIKDAQRDLPGILRRACAKIESNWAR